MYNQRRCWTCSFTTPTLVPLCTGSATRCDHIQQRKQPKQAQSRYLELHDGVAGFLHASAPQSNEATRSLLAGHPKSLTSVVRSTAPMSQIPMRGMLRSAVGDSMALTVERCWVIYSCPNIVCLLQSLLSWGGVLTGEQLVQSCRVILFVATWLCG